MAKGGLDNLKKLLENHKILIVLVVLLAIAAVVGIVSSLSVVGNYPVLSQDVSNTKLGQPVMITWSIGPDNLGGLNGAGGEIDVLYSLQSVQIDDQALLTYESCGSNCWIYTTTPADIGGSYISATLNTVTSMQVGTYYHASGYYMCDAVHQNIAGERFIYPKQAVYTLTVTGLPIGTHTVTTHMAGGQATSYRPDGTQCPTPSNARTLTDTFIVTGCDSNSDCSAGQVCTSNQCVTQTPVGCAYSNPPCPSGQACVDNACVSSMGCNPECQTGQTCVNSVCVAPSSDCTPACGSGQACVLQGGTNVCVASGCSSDSDCSAGYMCHNSQCVIKVVPPSSGIPWDMIILGIGAIFIIVVAFLILKNKGII